MSSYPRSPHRDIPPIGDAAVEALLAGSLPPADAEAELRPLAEAIAALRVAPGVHELAGEPAARAAYRGRFGRLARPARANRRRKRVLGSVLTAKVAVAAAVAAGALTSAAYADVLPAPVQNLAHRTLDAPAPHMTAPARQPRRAGLRGQQTRDGLCHAWAHAEADGRPGEKAVAFRNLAAAAGGAAQVTAYCAAAAHRGTQPPGQQVSHPQGKPSAASSPNPAGHANRQAGQPPEPPWPSGSPEPSESPAAPGRPIGQPPLAAQASSLPASAAGMSRPTNASAIPVRASPR